MWDTFKEKVSEKIAEIVIGLCLLLLLVFSYYIIDNYITPRVKTQLLSEGYLSEQIKAGKYITLDQESFSKNYEINAEKIVALQSEAYAEADSIKAIQSSLGELENKIQQALSASQKEVEEANQEIAELRGIIEALTSEKLNVTLFISSKEIDKGYIILNLHNPTIAHLVKNGEEYTVFGDLDEKETLKARVEIATDTNFPENAAIGRVHEDIYHKLFAGSSSGARRATIVLKN